MATDYGALPLAVLITNSQSAEALENGFALVDDTLKRTKTSFGGYNKLSVKSHSQANPVGFVGPPCSQFNH